MSLRSRRRHEQEAAELVTAYGASGRYDFVSCPGCGAVLESAVVAEPHRDGCPNAGRSVAEIAAAQETA